MTKRSHHLHLSMMRRTSGRPKWTRLRIVDVLSQYRHVGSRASLSITDSRRRDRIGAKAPCAALNVFINLSSIFIFSSARWHLEHFHDALQIPRQSTGHP
jgi:hypothetical protein